MQRVTEPIPEELRAILHDVSAMIRSGDKLVRIPSDDLIQYDSAYGGLSEDDPELFHFVYFDARGTSSKWYLSFKAPEIHSIASGDVKALMLFKCDLDRCPNRFSAEEHYCDYCSYWTEAYVSRPKSVDEDSCESIEEWLFLFTRVNPWATGMDAYNAYAHTPCLEARLGPLPAEVMYKGRLG